MDFHKHKLMEKTVAWAEHYPNYTASDYDCEIASQMLGAVIFHYGSKYTILWSAKRLERAAVFGTDEIDYRPKGTFESYCV